MNSKTFLALPNLAIEKPINSTQKYSIRYLKIPNTRITDVRKGGF
ncbi:hypothetical protein [uncultured Maribacter sp.]|nr:hypothetical protein [uncultured Maribacter sp.]